MTSINIKSLEQSLSVFANLDIKSRLLVIALLYTEIISYNSSDRCNN